MEHKIGRGPRNGFALKLPTKKGYIAPRIWLELPLLGSKVQGQEQKLGIQTSPLNPKLRIPTFSGSNCRFDVSAEFAKSAGVVSFWGLRFFFPSLRRKIGGLRNGRFDPAATWSFETQAILVWMCQESVPFKLVGVAQKTVPKWNPGKWKHGPKPA